MRAMINVCLLLFCIITQAHPPGISVAARLTGLEEFHWFENHGESNSDGVAPLASFLVLEPEKHAGGTISILFKHGVLDEALESLPEGEYTVSPCRVTSSTAALRYWRIWT